MDLSKALAISSAGMSTQSARLQVVAENLANAQSTAAGPGQEPYRRKTISFQNELDRASGIEKVKVGRIDRDRTEFERRYDPGHPAASADGYVLFPNVRPMVELMDMREAQRSYEANLNVVGATRSMLSHTVDLLRS